MSQTKLASLQDGAGSRDNVILSFDIRLKVTFQVAELVE
jgi:hypothetical protein